MTNRSILGPGTFEDVPFHEHDFNELSGELIISEAQITTLSASKITSGTITAQTITMAAGGIIRSDDFATGPGGAGYELSQGLAEFNNVTVRGTIFTGAGSDVDYAHVTSVAVDTLDLVDLAVTAGKIALGTITADQIDDLTITGGKIGNLEITASQIDNLTITSGKIGNSEVQNVNIQNGAVSTLKIGDLQVTSGKINDLTATKITAGTIGVHVIKLSNSSGSRIESNNGTSMIIRGDGSAVFTNVQVTGTVNATAGIFSGALTVSGSFNYPSTSASNRIRIIGGANPDIQIQSVQGVGGTNSRITFRNAGGLLGSLYPARAGSIDFLMLEAFNAAEYLYIFGGGTNTTTEIVGTGRRTGDVGISSHAGLTHAVGILTKGTGDVPLSLYHHGTVPAGGTHVVIHSANDISTRFHCKMLTRGDPTSDADELHFSFRMDGRGEANGGGKGWFTSSDKSLKKWMKPVVVADMIERIRRIPILAYADKGEKDQKRPRRIGPTAQGVQPSFPNSVSRGASGGPLGLETNETVWGLVSVVQDLLDRIDTLEAQAA